MPTLADVLRQTGYAQDGTLATPTPTESPMTKALADHLASIPQKFNENQAHQMELLGKAFPGNTYESMMTQGDPKAMAELAMQTPFNAMVAYHGTPHKILGNFDISKVGTGEGAQAYGHGMYFAESPEVSKTYMRTQINNAPELEKMAKNAGVSDDAANTVAQWYFNTKDKTKINDFFNSLSEKSPNETINKFREKVLSEKPKIEKAWEEFNKPGNLYKVDIPDEYIPNMLDWDKPFAQQPKNVQEAFAKFDSIAAQDPERNTIYMQRWFRQPSTAKKLEKMGYKGFQYLDEGSRAKGQGTRNFVVFDPSTVKILEENGKPLTRKELIEKQVKELKD